MGNQQGPTVWHREHCSMLCINNNQFLGKEFEKEYIYVHIYIYIYESLCCTPATNTTLLIYIKLYSNIKLKVSQKSVIPREKPLV